MPPRRSQMEDGLSADGDSDRNPEHHTHGDSNSHPNGNPHPHGQRDPFPVGHIHRHDPPE